MLKVFTYNFHKGKNFFGKKFCLKTFNQVINENTFDIGLFQEVLGAHKIDPSIPHQIEDIVDLKWHEYSFAKNSLVSNFDHGNAIISKLPMLETKIVDLSLINPFEKRSVIMSKIDRGKGLWVFSTHLSLFRTIRKRQLKIIKELILNLPTTSPIIIAGDFNDFYNDANLFFKKLNFSNWNENLKTFPCFYPLLSLDKIFYKNLKLKSLEVGNKSKFQKYSDHLPIFATFE